MTALIPFLLALFLAFLNIFLCAIKIDKRSSINLNLIFWAIILVLLILFKDEFGAGNLDRIFDGFILADKFAFGFSVILSVAMMIFLVSSLYSDESRFYKPEMIALGSLANFGLMAMSLSAELILTLIFVEIASIAVYAMIAMDKSLKSVESAFKYFVLSSFMSAFYLLGSGLIFGIAGSTKYEILSANLGSSTLGLIGVILVLSMMFFKIAIFGFYRWSVDVYFGANTNISGFLASSFKLGAFAILIKFCFVFELPNLNILQGFFAILAVLSMFGGNLLSLGQNDVKKILIMAGIVHSGYVFINLASYSQGVSLYPALFYLSTYIIVVAFAFGLLNSLFGGKNVSISELGGLYKTKPLEAFAFVLICLSFIGFPFSVGFLGKVFIFSSAVESGQVYLAVFGVINTIISVYYYLKIISSIYFGSNPNLALINSNSSWAFAFVAILFILLEGTGLFSLISFFELF